MGAKARGASNRAPAPREEVAMKTDYQIEQAVLTELRRQRLAEAVLGVAQVVNRLQVAIPDHRIRIDAALARAARDRIDWDAELLGADIRVTVDGGVVTLAGRGDHQ